MQAFSTQTHTQTCTNTSSKVIKALQERDCTSKFTLSSWANYPRSSTEPGCPPCHSCPPGHIQQWTVTLWLWTVLLCSVTVAPPAMLMEKVMSYFSLSICSPFPHSLSVSGGKWLSSSVFSARSSSRYLIIILSAARAWLIDVPLNCLLQADDLTKALCSTWPLLFSSSKTRWLHLLFTTTPFYGSRHRNKLSYMVDGCVLRCV